jgi:hypothetical protein
VREDIIKSNPIRGHMFEYPAKVSQESDYDDDPFAAIEGSRDVWTATNVLRCFEIV